MSLNTEPTLVPAGLPTAVLARQIGGPELARAVTAESPEEQGKALSLLIGQVYESASPPLKARLLQRMIAPLGVLAAVAVAHGVFARLKLQTGWHDLQSLAPELQKISADDVVALADRVQLVGTDALLRLADVIGKSPVLASSAAAALLMTLLIRKAQNSPPAED
ncbi:MAG: hypothetical protein JZU58_09710 [Curvibacter lanceolatus]|uniref:hypothetical protein n=1 Tax=Curvibacter lanceolatus TaxID=86182 RepID=UPI002357E69F|nr:hypothetical protein [Curvibacter lanceolatus]MBV5292616.1 hypothetical protein [Curvibacter lanceolatus]